VILKNRAPDAQRIATTVMQRGPRNEWSTIGRRGRMEAHSACRRILGDTDRLVVLNFVGVRGRVSFGVASRFARCDF